ncbi:hypothetical protein RA307_05810 [Xanthobacteraceae bacterium Astr-EGSB]|uniref:hypothetical protein n=1 Tax=Astrobacterium formosum TaxID=3069710 RepID=UPI0027B7BC42|nr:hypothetical protein [Xanthobacteraceae bacterium Astr-EGSB]
MWWRRRNNASDSADEAPRPLREAIRLARIDSAERTGVVVELRDADIARLEILNEALDPLFADIPPEMETFDRGVARGDTPRLWIDAVAHVHMGRDKLIYRFVRDGRFGREVLAESSEVPEIAAAVTRYVARRIVEREQMLAGRKDGDDAPSRPPRRRGRTLLVFLFGVVVGAAAVLAAAWWSVRVP